VTNQRLAENTPLLGCDRLRCGRSLDVLADVSWRVCRGEFWCLFGPNGSGKSTLLATLLGLLPPRGGTVLPVAHGDRSRLGYVPQQQRFDLPLPITVAEFVTWGLDTFALRAAAKARLEAVLPTLGLVGLAQRRIQALSLGQQRRVLIARALARRPDLLVLDEPLANLDDEGATLLLRDLARLCREQQLTVVLVTHEHAAASELASHLAWIADGRLHTRCKAASPAASLPESAPYGGAS